MLVYIDHYDSFTDILIDYFKQLKIEVKVIKSDQVTIEKVRAINPEYIVIGPGPGHPEDVSLTDIYDMFEYYCDKLPILGICLGHQIICRFFGAKIKRLSVVQHGLVSTLSNAQGIMFESLGKIEVTRYHSLIASNLDFPSCLKITATCMDGDDSAIMACEHNDYPIYGLQFHPEAIMTSHGLKILENFLAIKKKQPY